MGLRKEKREGDESAFVAVAPRRSLVVDQADLIADRSISETLLPVTKFNLGVNFFSEGK